MQATGKPYVIENVENARAELRNPIKVCGTMLGLPVWRHRYFEVWPFWFMSPATCKHYKHPITVHSGSHTRKTWEPVRCTGGARQGVRPRESVDVVRWAMGIPWMLQRELTEAIPPAYTEWLGKQLLAALEAQ
jgi:DNA (cytosine-5)-methyltransferase 1